MTLALRFAARSHAGLLRSMNEDSVYAGPRLLAVADGMGGHAAGEVASAVAIASLAPLDEDAPGPDLLAALQDAARSANQHLRDMVAADGALHGMGTTLVALLFSGARLGLLHVGDSRCYLLRGGELSQITHDHTLVQTLIDEGRISEEEAGSHPQRSVITRVLDGRDDVELDLSVRESRPGDRYLLCSDGLTGPVGSLDTLREALQITDPQECVDRLVELALRGGGPDNVTVIVADVVDEDVPASDPVVAGAAAESPQEAPPGLADSPAGRARAAQGRDEEPPPVPVASEQVAPRSRRRYLVAGVGALVLLLAGSAAGWAYVRSQYYVGLDGRNVAVFRGVTGHIAGLPLSNVEMRTDLTTDRLSELEQARLEDGIVASDARDARAIVERLLTSVECSTPAPTTPPTPAVAAPTPRPAP
ncbi:MAG: PP2C family serine/threonine-protein phosphatase, partial [Mycobacteriales bacterium]